MHIKVSIEFDTDVGDYEADVENLGEPGEPMDLEEISNILERI